MEAKHKRMIYKIGLIKTKAEMEKSCFKKILILYIIVIFYYFITTILLRYYIILLNK